MGWEFWGCLGLYAMLWRQVGVCSWEFLFAGSIAGVEGGEMDNLSWF